MGPNLFYETTGATGEHTVPANTSLWARGRGGRVQCLGFLEDARRASSLADSARREIAPVRLAEHDDVEVRRMVFLGRIHHVLRLERQQRVSEPGETAASRTVQIQRDTRRMHRQWRAIRWLAARRTNGARDLEWRAACLRVFVGQTFDERPGGGCDVRIADAMQRVVPVGREAHQIAVSHRAAELGGGVIEVEIVVIRVGVRVSDALVGSAKGLRGGGCGHDAQRTRGESGDYVEQTTMHETRRA